MEIKKEHEEQIINFGVFDYDAIKIASILGFNEDEVANEMIKKDSVINKLLQKGKNMADYVIDLRLFEMAKAGDLKAIEKLDYRKRTRAK